MSTVAFAMAEKEPEYCSYSTVKVDSDVLPIVKAAAAFAGVKVQEWVSDILNEASAKATSRKPVKRRPIKPK